MGVKYNVPTPMCPHCFHEYRKGTSIVCKRVCPTCGKNKQPIIIKINK